ncbi:hypothetical protein [Bacillus cereus]|nr:hypothetical protein [Bacillus cereus]
MEFVKYMKCCMCGHEVPEEEIFYEKTKEGERLPICCDCFHSY